MDGADRTIHGTCVSFGCRHGVLIRGPSGAGKSDLALRLITSASPEGLEIPAPLLVADDQVVLSSDGEDVAAAPPDRLAGLLEVRGLGVMAFPYRARTFVRLVVDAGDVQDVPRLPDPGLTVDILGSAIPVFKLAFLESSAVAKIYLAVRELSKPETVDDGGNQRRPAP